MALTLVEAAKVAMGRDEDLRATVMELYARSSDLMATMPFENIQGNALQFNREQTLPSVGFRGVNEAYSEGTGKLERVTEALCIAGGDLDVDKFIVTTGGPGQREAQEAMKIKALSLSMTKNLIKGDVTSDPKSFDGLQVRCILDQKITAMPQDTAGATAATLTLLKMDELIDSVEDPTHLIMNKKTRRRLSQAARNTGVSGYITYELDAFGRRVTYYSDVPILVVDKDNENNDIMPHTETADDGGSDAVSVYCVSFAENGVVGLQNGEMDVRDLGEIDTKPVFRTRVEWYISMAIMRPRAATRLWNIADLPVEAD